MSRFVLYIEKSFTGSLSVKANKVPERCKCVLSFSIIIIKIFYKLGLFPLGLVYEVVYIIIAHRTKTNANIIHS